MKKVQLSNTYKFLFNNIIGELLSQICARFPYYYLKDRKIPYSLNEKIEEYREKANNNMSNPRLDRHKLASCICGAILETQPLVSRKGKEDSQRANEFLALYVGLNVVKAYMMYDLVNDLDAPIETKVQIKDYLRDHFDMRLPSIDENICDTQEYEINMRNALHWTHHNCEFKNGECYHYDVWAYAKIFYHLELYNKPRIDDVYRNYKGRNKKEE